MIFPIYKIFQNFKILDSSLITMFNLHVLLKTNRFFLENCTRDHDSRAPLFFTEIEETWRHSNVIYGRPIRALENFFGQGV